MSEVDSGFVSVREELLYHITLYVSDTLWVVSNYLVDVIKGIRFHSARGTDTRSQSGQDRGN